MLWKRVYVGPRERVLIAKNHRFAGILQPGTHRVLSPPGVSLEVERHDLGRLVFRSPWSRYLAAKRPDVIERYFTLVETSRVEVGLVYADGRLFRVLTPASRLVLWRAAAEITVEKVEVLPELDSSSDVFEKLVK